MTKLIKLRTLLVGGMITLLFVVLVGRIYWVQVVNADFWTEKARAVWSRSETLMPTRGSISDRDGNILAMDVNAYGLAIDPDTIHKLGVEEFVISKLSLILGKSKEEISKSVNAKRDNGEYFKWREVRNGGWRLDKEVKDRLLNLREELKEMTKQNNVGIFILDQQKRYYPKNRLASHIVGYQDKEGAAVTGFEAYFDEQLKGVEGKIQYKRDGNGVILDSEKVEFEPPHDGKNVKLTIDTDIQHYIEDAIKEAYDEYKPKNIFAIAADPNTMDILGMASYPNFNPNEYSDFEPGAFYNHMIKSQFEPGSTFKIVTLASAVEEGVFDPEEKYVSGRIKVGNGYKRDVNRDGWGTITFLEGLKRSSNVAFVKLGYERLGAEKLIKYIRDFGFGEKTGIELPGEISGGIKINPNIPDEVASATFGQGRVTVTAIQQVAAVAAVANGGKLLQPHVIKEIEDPVTKKTKVIEPKLVRQVISPQTSKLVGEYLEQVVSDKDKGTGKNAYLPGYRVAGKTGTAQKVVKGSSGYSSEKYVVSFIGYAPVDDPKIVVLVVADEPQGGSSSGGGKVAAPVFKKIVEKSLRHMNVRPRLDAKEIENLEEITITVPDVVGSDVSKAKDALSKKELSAEVVGKGKVVKQQIPKKGTVVSPSQKVYLITEDREKIAVPDMRGLSMRDALEICSLLNIRFVTVGQGFVTDQVMGQKNGERVLKLVLKPPGEPDQEETTDEKKDEKQE
ncbi:penicillin-binding transpeptidase domain-containing protein [Paenibacillus sp. GCM10027626]|uniref:penicillin-binding transpeptidase domain-containing protein n=1 Tax=Paenibacillus sp. GCM10027626 TaxID=3273411 RepID=UPI0036271C16